MKETITIGGSINDIKECFNELLQRYGREAKVIDVIKDLETQHL